MKEMEKMKNKREEKRVQMSESRMKRAQVEYNTPIRGNSVGPCTTIIEIKTYFGQVFFLESCT